MSEEVHEVRKVGASACLGPGQGQTQQMILESLGNWFDCKILERLDTPWVAWWVCKSASGLTKYMTSLTMARGHTSFEPKKDKKDKYASLGTDKRNARVIYLEGLWTSLISKEYPDMESERVDVTTAVILSKSGCSKNPWGLGGITTLDKLVRGEDTNDPEWHNRKLCLSKL